MESMVEQIIWFKNLITLNYMCIMKDFLMFHLCSKLCSMSHYMIVALILKCICSSLHY
jgi:hypothetical protein